MAKWYFLILFFIFLILPVEAVTTTIDFKEQYRDSIGIVHDFNNANLAEYPMYTILETPDNYWISRAGDSIYLPKKSWIEYQFYPERIVPRYKIDNFSQINTLVTKVNASVWYLSVPFSAYRYKSLTDDLIDFGAFKRTTKITVTDSNTTACGLFENISCPDYRVVPKVIDNNIRLYFNPQNFSNVVYPLFLTENTVTVDNSTFWANHDCGDGYWSAYGGGSCATPLNATIHSNLSGYWDMESTTGTHEFGINSSSHFPTINGTWNGNTTLNYTSGQYWGNAVLFDGINDYVQIPDSDAFTIPAGSKATWNVVQKNNNATSVNTNVIHKYGLVATFEWIMEYFGSNIYFWVYDDTAGSYRGRYAPAPSNLTFHKLQSTYNGGTVPTSVAIYIDDIKSDTTNFTFGIFTTMRNTTQPVDMADPSAGSAGYFNGSMDEVILTSDGLPIYSNSTYITIWNMTFSNVTAATGQVVNAVKFNIYNLNNQNNTANISARETGNSTWTVINTTYVSDTWINQTFWESTDFAVNVSGNGSSRAFIVSMTYDETLPSTFEITGYVNNTLGSFVDGALVTINGASTLSRHTYLVNNTDLCNFNHTSMLCDGSRQSGVNYIASTNIQLIVFSHASAVAGTAEIVVNVDGVNITHTSGRPLGGAEESYKHTVVLIPKYAIYNVTFSNYHHFEWREYPLVHGYYNLTSTNGTQSVLAQQIGYANFTGTLNVTSNMTYNITLQEKETVSEGTVIDYSLVGAILGGLLAFVLLRRKRKDDDYKYKRE